MFGSRVDDSIHFFCFRQDIMDLGRNIVATYISDIIIDPGDNSTLFEVKILLFLV